MARTVGKLLVTIWNDDDWRALTKDAQRLYMLLLAQGRLSLAGCIDLMPSRWADLAVDDTVDDLNRALLELEDRRFVAIDWRTSELVVRTLAKHDVGNGTLNRNLIKGFWSAWQAILSADLRATVAANTPAPLWEKNPDDVPDAAQHLRRSGRLEPESEPQSPTAVRTAVATPGSIPTSPSPSPSPSSTTVPTEPHPLTRPRRDDRPTDEELDAETNRRVGQAVAAGRCDPSPTRTAAYARTTRANLIAEGWTPTTHRPDPNRRPAHPDAATVMADALPDPTELEGVDSRAGLARARAAITQPETTDT